MDGKQIIQRVRALCAGRHTAAGLLEKVPTDRLGAFIIDKTDVAVGVFKPYAALALAVLKRPNDAFVGKVLLGPKGATCAFKIEGFTGHTGVKLRA